MKRQLVFVLCFCILFAFAGPASADEELANPSFYSAGEMVMDIPGFWIANYIEIQEYMKKFPDFQCEHYSQVFDTGNFDQIVCSSVNNKWARDVIINFYFSGDHAGMTGLQEVVFTLGTPHSEDIQQVLEYFWHPEAFPWHRDTDQFFDNIMSLMFYTSDTAMRFDLPVDRGDGGDKYTTVDFWDSKESRMGVG